jgi:hypothetical protein
VSDPAKPTCPIPINPKQPNTIIKEIKSKKKK